MDVRWLKHKHGCMESIPFVGDHLIFLNYLQMQVPIFVQDHKEHGPQVLNHIHVLAQPWDLCVASRW